MTKFLGEFNFANGRFFLCFAGTNFCDREKLVFLCWELIFAIQFRKLPSTVCGIITFSFFEYKQWNTGEQHADV